MVPAMYVELEKLPLTANGKVDRKALPDPDRTSDSAAYVPPRTETEEILASIWAEVLGLERVGVEDNFFELGGHSLLATQVMSRVSRRFLIEVPLRKVFEFPTIAMLASEVDDARLHQPEMPAAITQPVPAIKRLSREAYRASNMASD